MTLVPEDVRINVSASFPTQVRGANGIGVAKANGIYTISDNYPALGQVIWPATPANSLVKIYDTVTGVYNVLPLSAFPTGGGGGGGISDAPVDSFAYGRVNATWQRVLPLTGGTVTGALTVNNNVFNIAGTGAFGIGTATPNSIGTGFAIAGGVQSGVCTINVNPIANPLATSAGLVVNVVDQPAASTAGGTGLEYALVAGIKSTHNGGSIDPNKVGIYGSVELIGATCGGGWGANFVAVADSGAAATPLQGIEVDVNNNSVARNYTNLGTPIYGVSITGVSSFTSTAALLFSGGPWYTGLAFNNFRAASSAFGIDFGFDANNSFSTAAIRCLASVSGTYLADFINSNKSNADAGIVVGAGLNHAPQAGDTSVLIGFVDGGNGFSLGSISRVATGVSFNTSSDERLKTNISTLDGAQALATISAVRPVNYARTGSPDTMHVGFLAQELVDVVPDAVTRGGADPAREPWMVDQSMMIPLIVASIHDLERRLAAMEAALATKAA